MEASTNDRDLRTPAVHGSVFEPHDTAPSRSVPDPIALIRIRDRLTAHVEGPAPTTRWCVCGNLHYQFVAIYTISVVIPFEFLIPVRAHDCP
jgi:hypothetical protein